MKCPKCEGTISSNTNFCPICGYKIQTIFTKQLIQAAKNHDQNAITVLYNETYNYVYQSIKAIIKVDEDTVLDLVQDTYMRAFKYLDQLDNPENFKAWVKRIGANTAKNYLKKKKPVLFSELAKDDEEPQEFQFKDERPDHMPEFIMDQKETARLVDEILDSLSDDQRLAVNLFYFQEMSVKEIALVLGCSENTVKSRLNYGRKKVEIKVKELEKKGTKLYGFAPLPFLLLLFHSQEASAAVLPNAQILHSIQAKLFKSAAHATAGSNFSTATNNIAKATTKVAAKAAVKTTATTGAKLTVAKVAAGIAVAAVISTAGVIAYKHTHTAPAEPITSSEVTEVEATKTYSTQEAIPEEASETIPVQEAVPEENEPETIPIQEAVLEENVPETIPIQEAIPEENVPETAPTQVVSSEAAIPEENENDHSIYDGILSEFQQRFNQEYPSDGLGNAYAYFDLNNDGRDEFIIANIYYENGEYISMDTICGIYTVIDHEPKQILEGWSRNTYQIFEGNYILNVGSSGADDTSYEVLQLNSNGMLEKADITPDLLGAEATEEAIGYIQLNSNETTVEPENNPVTSASSDNHSFEEILATLRRVSAMSKEGYSGSPEHYNEEYSYLGEGVLELIVYREEGPYTLDLYSLEYDIDNDGEYELMVGRGTAPSHVSPIAIYKQGNEPIVGEALSYYTFTDNGYGEYPLWNYIEPEYY